VEGIATASQAESLLPPAAGTGMPHGLGFPYKQITNKNTFSVPVMKYCVAYVHFRGLFTYDNENDNKSRQTLMLMNLV
jgi:hypothetical protein